MALRAKTKILLAKVETTYGIDPVPTGAANGMLAKEIKLEAMAGNDLSRDLERPALGAQPTIPVGLHSKISFKVEIEPSGVVGVAPAWGPLLRACACAQVIDPGVSVTYNPVSSGHESVTIYFWVEGSFYKIVGAVGTAKLHFMTQEIPYIEFEFTGQYRTPLEAARQTPDLSGFKKPRQASTQFTPVVTLAGTTFVTKNLDLDLGNTVEQRLWIGAESISISDKVEQIDMTVEAVPLTTFNPYQAALDAIDVPLVLTHGVGAGRIATLNVPKAQMQRMAGLSEEQNIIAWPLKLVPQPGAAFDDQWTLRLT